MSTQHAPMILTADRFDHKAGITVYHWTGYDYGLRSDDERATGVAHICVSLQPGEHSFFTVPAADVCMAMALGSTS